jgi:hypothetical protein
MATTHINVTRNKTVANRNLPALTPKYVVRVALLMVMSSCVAACANDNPANLNTNLLFDIKNGAIVHPSRLFATL